MPYRCPIKASVGEAGTNNGPDVKCVQLLLNNWLAGHAMLPLAIDGRCGPLTIGAMKRFQATFLPVPDGRADVNGPTIRRLVDLQVQILSGGFSGYFNSWRDGFNVASTDMPRGGGGADYYDAVSNLLSHLAA
jgi:peptidoglycan hydrolase-like protein with peptidoglycan-binding domain